MRLRERSEIRYLNMGNYRFSLLWDMMPNSWFYKLRDMSIIRRRRKQQKKETSSLDDHQLVNNNNSQQPRKSHYFSRQLIASSKSPVPEPPTKSSKRKPMPRRPPSSLLTSNSSGRTLQSNMVVTTNLPPILTTSDHETNPPDHAVTTKKDNDEHDHKCIAKESRSSPSRRFILNSPGPKLRIMNSPRVSSKRFGSGRKSRNLSDTSVAIVKSTNDPRRDFRESMVEMILENKIRGSSDLEDLLASYLSLNTYEYHDIIVQVFKQVWFDFTTDIIIA